MSLQEEIEQLDKELSALNLPFDKGLPILQRKVWAIADRNGMTGPEVMARYLDWKSSRAKE